MSVLGSSSPTRRSSAVLAVCAVASAAARVLPGPPSSCTGGRTALRLVRNPALGANAGCFIIFFRGGGALAIKFINYQKR